MRRTCRIALAGVIVALAGCSNVPYHEKQELGLRIMQFDPNPLESSFQNKIIYAREVSGGRPGNAAGGGCGCGN